MSTNEISTYFKYANLQMAAEAFLVNPKTGACDFSGQPLIDALKTGNNHASKFTSIAAEQFEKDWVVVAQQPNTGTGFSGTLFRCKVADEARGLRVGDLVLSFRSTEFIDDSAHDNQATNVLEVKQYGWAFGQIDDMEAWYAELSKLGGPLSGQRFAVTGYSLGANLATAFNFLRREEATRLGIPKAFSCPRPIRNSSRNSEVPLVANQIFWRQAA